MAPPRILCIDDFVRGLEIRKQFLEQLGFRVVTAADGATALDLFGRSDFDAVVLDFRMPGMNGEVVARELKRRKPEVPILLLSGYPSLIPESMLQTTDAFLWKGWEEPKALVRLLVQMTGKQPEKPSPEETLRKLREASALQLKMDRRITDKWETAEARERET
jgi:CheY-like chemotaxis protein